MFFSRQKISIMAASPLAKVSRDPGAVWWLVEREEVADLMRKNITWPKHSAVIGYYVTGYIFDKIVYLYFYLDLHLHLNVTQNYNKVIRISEVIWYEVIVYVM